MHEAEEGEHRPGQREGRGPQELPLDHEDRDGGEDEAAQDGPAAR
jgi:hypothetical protein